MTVAARPASVSYYEDGQTVSFPAPFRFKSARDLVVERIRFDSTIVTLQLGVDYTVSGGGTDAGGTVTRTAATSGAMLRVRRWTARAQLMTYTTGDRFPATSHEEALDQQMLVSQEQDATIDETRDRALMVPAGEVALDLPNAVARSGAALVFDDDGRPVAKPIGSFPAGPTGTSNNTRADLAALRAAPTTDLSSLYDGSVWFWTPGDYEGLINNRTIVASSVAPISSGAWIRSQPVINVRDYGAKGDGTTNDSAAFGLAARVVSAAGGGRIELRGGTFVINNVSLSGLSNITWVGTGATIKGPGRTLCYFNISGATNITFTGLTFDQMKGTLPTYTPADYANGPLNVPLYANIGAANLTVTECIFRDLYTTAIYFDKCTKLTIRDCDFLSGVQQQNQWAQHLHIQTGFDITIFSSRFINDPISNPDYGVSSAFASGVRRFVMRDCRLSYCGRNNAGTHRLGAIDFYGDVTDVYVADCVMTDCMAEAIRLNACFGGRLTNLRITVNQNAEFAGNTIAVTGSTIFGQNKGQRDIEIVGCSIEDPFARAAGTIVIVSYDWGAPSRKISVRETIFNGCRSIVRVIGPFDRISIERCAADSGRGHIVIVNGSGLLSEQGVEANSLYDGLVIRGCKITDDSGDGANAINIALSNATSAFVGTFIAEDNILRASIPSPAPSIFGLMNSTNRTNTRSYFRRNEIRGYATGLFFQNHGEGEAINNRLIGITTPLVEAGMTTPVVKRGNRYSAGAQQGRSALVAGVADIATAEAMPGDRIILQRVTGGGAIGSLVVENITAGSGFQVRSKDAAGALVTTDTGQFDWSFDH